MSGKAKLGIALAVLVLAGIPLAGKLKKGDTRAANTYTLVSVDGHSVPYAPRYSGRRTAEIVSSSLTLNADGTFVSTMKYGKSAGGRWPVGGGWWAVAGRKGPMGRMGQMMNGEQAYSDCRLQIFDCGLGIGDWLVNGDALNDWQARGIMAGK